jgi:hypothetical protein
VLVANDLMEHAVGRVAGGHTRGRTGLSVKGCEMSVTRCDRLDTALDSAIIRADSDRANASYRLPGYAVPVACYLCDAASRNAAISSPLRTSNTSFTRTG